MLKKPLTKDGNSEAQYCSEVMVCQRSVGAWIELTSQQIDIENHLIPS